MNDTDLAALLADPEQIPSEAIPRVVGELERFEAIARRKTCGEAHNDRIRFRSMTTMNGFGDLPLMLTADETAELLRKSRTAIYTMVDRGQLPGAIKIERNLLFRRDDVIRWLSESSPKAWTR